MKKIVLYPLIVVGTTVLTAVLFYLITVLVAWLTNGFPS